MQRGLGVVIVGGFCFAPVLSLYMTLLLYLAFAKLGKRFLFMFNRREQKLSFLGHSITVALQAYKSWFNSIFFKYKLALRNSQWEG